MGAVAAVAGVASIGLQVAGGYQASLQAKLEGKIQQNIASFNAATSEFLAADALRRGEEESKIFQSETKGMLAKQRVAFAAQGVDITDAEGSVGDVLENIAFQREQDKMELKNIFWLQAFGYTVQSSESVLAGQFAMQTARSRARSTLITTAAGVFSTAAQTAGTYAKLKEKPNPYGTARPGANPPSRRSGYSNWNRGM